VKLQYKMLWDYCETIRKTNIGSCVLMKVERPLPDCPAKFHRLYFSIAAMKRGFLTGCRPIIRLDGCFLKGPYKGQLMTPISRDANNNMYLVAFAVLETEVKDNWSWFLKTLLLDLGIPPAEGWTFISDRQKVTLQVFFFIYSIFGMLQMVVILCICECLTILTDCVKGLVSSFDVVASGADYWICVRHLYANYRDACHRCMALKDKLWSAAAA